MTDLLVRGLDEAVVRALERRAAARGARAEDAAREILTTAARLDRVELVERLRKIQALTPEPNDGAEWLSAVELIRSGRDSR